MYRVMFIMGFLLGSAITALLIEIIRIIRGE